MNHCQAKVKSFYPSSWVTRMKPEQHKHTVFMATNSYLNYCIGSASLGLTISTLFFVASTKLNPYEREIIFGEVTNALFAEPKSATTLTQVPALSLFSLIRAREAASSFSLIKENKKL